MPDNSALQHAALATANEMMNTFKHNDLSTIAKARKVAERILGQGWSEKGADIYTELKEGEPVPECFAISNCHSKSGMIPSRAESDDDRSRHRLALAFLCHSAESCSILVDSNRFVIGLGCFVKKLKANRS